MPEDNDIRSKVPSTKRTVSQPYITYSAASRQGWPTAQIASFGHQAQEMPSAKRRKGNVLQNFPESIRRLSHGKCDGGNSEQDSPTSEQNHDSDLQLIYSPKLLKKAGRGQQSTSLSNERTMYHFHNASTDTTRSSKKSFKKVSDSKSNSTHCNWTTTEDRLRSSTAGLAGLLRIASDSSFGQPTLISAQGKLRTAAWTNHNNNPIIEPSSLGAVGIRTANDCFDTNEPFFSARPRPSNVFFPNKHLGAADYSEGLELQEESVIGYQEANRAHRPAHIQAYEIDHYNNENDDYSIPLLFSPKDEIESIKNNAVIQPADVMSGPKHMKDKKPPCTTKASEWSTVDDFDDDLDEEALLSLVSKVSASATLASCSENGHENASKFISICTEIQSPPCFETSASLTHANELVSIGAKHRAATSDMIERPDDARERHACILSGNPAINEESTNRKELAGSLQFPSPQSRILLLGNVTNADLTNSTDSSSVSRNSNHWAHSDHAVSIWASVSPDNATKATSTSLNISTGEEVHALPSKLTGVTVIKQFCSARIPAGQGPTPSSKNTLERQREQQPLQPFARPKYPDLIRDRSLVNGFATHVFLRTCFRIGEMIKEGARCRACRQDAIIELFARVTLSSRELNSSKQHFQFADLFHDRPPFPKGVLANWKSSNLVEIESRLFIEREPGMMARCLGRLKRDVKGGCWVLAISQIRPTDWGEVRWIQQVVSAGMVNFGEAA